MGRLQLPLRLVFAASQTLSTLQLLSQTLLWSQGLPPTPPNIIFPNLLTLHINFYNVELAKLILPAIPNRQHLSLLFIGAATILDALAVVAAPLHSLTLLAGAITDRQDSYGAVIEALLGSLKSDVALKDLREIPLGAKRDEVEQARGGGAGLLETLDGRDISLVGEDWMSFLPFFEAVEGREVSPL